ncbi:MAG: heavy metal-binding domain-containing protein [Candidatus Nanopelagicales bacterium]
MTQTTPAGWYPNPENPTQLRWWDGTAWTDQVQASISEQSPGEVGAGPAVYSGPPIIVVTTNDMPGYRITAVHGEVFGITVRARNAFSNMGAGFRTMFGGEAKGYTKLLSDSRLEAVERLRYAAHQVGGNAVVAMRFDTGEIADLMNEVAAYGTAVTVERID